MSDAEPLHYRFPPASAYRLNRCLFALKSDDDFRARFLKDARTAMRELGLGGDDAAAVLQGDRDTLLARGGALRSGAVRGGSRPAYE